MLYTAGAAMAADCRDAVAAIERAMQDGLSDLAVARGLRDEALAHSGAAPGSESAACRFLTHGRDAYRRAEGHFSMCEARLDEILADCPDPDWSILSASPQSCRATRAEIENSLETLVQERGAACGG